MIQIFYWDSLAYMTSRVGFKNTDGFDPSIHYTSIPDFWLVCKKNREKVSFVTGQGSMNEPPFWLRSRKKDDILHLLCEN
jgi:hypothetical protein